MAVNVENPTGYGRIILDGQGNLSAIVEEADASEGEKAIRLINTGIYAVNRSFLASILPELKAENAQAEIYLTDIIAIAYGRGKSIGILVGDDSSEIIGVNSPAELQQAEKLMKLRKIERS